MSVFFHGPTESAVVFFFSLLCSSVLLSELFGEFLISGSDLSIVRGFCKFILL